MNEQSGSTGVEPAARESRPGVDEHLTLARAAKLAPGRPSANCVWRWCREGVKVARGSAGGWRLRLKTSALLLLPPHCNAKRERRT